MDLDLLSPLCAADAPPLPIDSIDDRKARYARLASPSPSLSSGGRMLMEFDETVMVWRAWGLPNSRRTIKNRALCTMHGNMGISFFFS
jgi:hypothetical protein